MMTRNVDVIKSVTSQFLQVPFPLCTNSSEFQNEPKNRQSLPPSELHFLRVGEALPPITPSFPHPSPLTFHSQPRMVVIQYFFG